jgi:magnesium transporter
MSAHKDLALILYNYKNEISYIRKNIRPQKDIMYHLQKSDSPLIQTSTQPFIEDLIELVNQTLESIEIYYTMVTDQLNLYNSYVNNKANEVMKFLTMFASIFIPLTFLAGVYGTNFDFLPELHYKYSYFIMWGVMVTMSVSMLIYFKKKKWL